MSRDSHPTRDARGGAPNPSELRNEPRIDKNDRPGLDIIRLTEFLPHRYPFLLVDRVMELVPGQRVTGYKNVTINEPFFGGHFPGHPIMPGVLIVEAMAQVSGVLAMATRETPPEGSIFYLAGMDNTRFKRRVVPGDRLDMESTLLVERRLLMKFACRAEVAGELACETQILCVARTL